VLGPVLRVRRDFVIARDGIDDDRLARLDFDARFKRRIEVAPVHVIEGRIQVFHIVKFRIAA